MAKTGKRRAESAARSVVGSGDALASAVATFARGDYARARRELAVKADDPSLSEGQREEARELIAATRLERGTLLVGLACVGLLILVLVITALTQPH